MYNKHISFSIIYPIRHDFRSKKVELITRSKAGASRFQVSRAVQDKQFTPVQQEKQYTTVNQATERRQTQKMDDSREVQIDIYFQEIICSIN